MAKETKTKTAEEKVEEIAVNYSTPKPEDTEEEVTTSPAKENSPVSPTNMFEAIKMLKEIVEARSSFPRRIVAARKALQNIQRNGRVIIEDGKTLVSYVQLDDLLPMVDKALEDTGTMYMSYYKEDIMYIELFDIETGRSLFLSGTPLPTYKELADFGRTSTYIRRYLLATVIGISIATDSDAVSGTRPVEAPTVVATPTVEYKKVEKTAPVIVQTPVEADKAPEQPSLFKEEIKEAPIIKKEVPEFPARVVTPEETTHNEKIAELAKAPTIVMPTYSDAQRDASAIIYAKAAKSINDSPNEVVLDDFKVKIENHPTLIESDKRRLLDLIADKLFNLK